MRPFYTFTFLSSRSTIIRKEGNGRNQCSYHVTRFDQYIVPLSVPCQAIIVTMMSYQVRAVQLISSFEVEWQFIYATSECKTRYSSYFGKNYSMCYFPSVFVTSDVHIFLVPTCYINKGLETTTPTPRTASFMTGLTFHLRISLAVVQIR